MTSPAPSARARQSKRGVCLMLAVLSAAMTDAGADAQVPRWHPHDFVFRGPARVTNPFAVRFEAVVKGPEGAQFVLPGFYDGGRRWALRVAPTLEGEWSLRTVSSEATLDGREITFRCVANRNDLVRGGLRVDRERPHHFIFEDGSRCFLMGYECDWLWALDVDDPAVPTVSAFLDNLKAHGFNMLTLNAFAYDCPWQRGRTGPDDFGPPPIFAWAESNERPDHSRMNVAYWQHYDRVVDALYRRGIIAHIMIKVYNKMVRWPQNASPEDDLYFRWIVARYCAYPNVVWDFSKEAQNEKDVRYKVGRIRLIRTLDPYQRLVTVHDDDAAYDAGAYDGLADFRCDQQHSRWHETLLRQRRRRAWPIVNIEFGYEHGPGGPDDKTYGVAQPPEELCRRAWEICMAGGYVNYYYTYTAWDVIRPSDEPPGYVYFSNLRRFFEGTRYWRLEPADDLVTRGYCLAEPGREYVVFVEGDEATELDVKAPSGGLAAEWFHPLTARIRPAGTLTTGRARLKPPEG
ncbi:MAG: DUF4038 domain-containing protein, partial [Armatimonadota bacterium]